MPCLEITLPDTDIATRKKLASALTAALAASTRFDADIFGIRFLSYGAGEAAVGGVLSEDSERPYVHFLLYCPRISRTTKQKLIADLTATFIAVTGRETWIPVIHISEHPYDNIGVDGRLLSDSHEECAKRAFYYDTPRD